MLEGVDAEVERADRRHALDLDALVTVASTAARDTDLALEDLCLRALPLTFALHGLLAWMGDGRDDDHDASAWRGVAALALPGTGDHELVWHVALRSGLVRREGVRVVPGPARTAWEGTRLQQRNQRREVVRLALCQLTAGTGGRGLHHLLLSALREPVPSRALLATAVLARSSAHDLLPRLRLAATAGLAESGDHVCVAAGLDRVVGAALVGDAERPLARDVDGPPTRHDWPEVHSSRGV